MILKHGCAILRAIDMKDAPFLLKMMNEPSVDKMAGSPHLPMSLTQQEEWIRNYHNTEETIRLMVELTNGKTIGLIILQNIDYKNRSAELGIKTFVEDFHDRIKGDTADAYKAIFDYCFNELNLNCIYAFVREDNLLSISFTEKMGFKKEGILRHRQFTGGHYKDLISYSILKEEYIALGL